MKIILLCGVPGSGKTTFAKEKFGDYHRISQDDLGSKDKCIEEFRSVASQNKNILVDRCNHNVKQRKLWLDMGLNYGAESIGVIHLIVPEEECIARVLNRKDHPTINESLTVDKKREIIYSFNREIHNQPPTIEEGFNFVTYMRN